MWGYFTNFKTMELTGTTVKIKNIEIISAKTEGAKDFQKREFWLKIHVGGTPHEKYPQTINLELHGESVAALDYFTEGQEIKVSINLKGRIVEDKCFNTLQVWRIKEVKKI
jgi:single-strand DNA-binding protein